MSWFKEVIESLMPVLIPKASKSIREELTAFLDKLEKKAAATKNPFDDILVIVIRKAFNL